MDSLNYACLLGQSSSFVHRGKKSAVYYSIEISPSDLNFNMRFVVPFSLRLFLEPTELIKPGLEILNGTKFEQIDLNLNDRFYIGEKKIAQM